MATGSAAAVVGTAAPGAVAEPMVDTVAAEEATVGVAVGVVEVTTEEE